MPTLSNRHHELFAQAVAGGETNREAYKLAGYSVSSNESADAAAGRLVGDVRVKARVAELQEDAAKAAGATLEKVLSTFINVLNEDAEAKPGDRIRAAELIGKHLGMFRDKIEHTGKDGSELIPKLDDEAIARRLAFILAKGAAQT